MAPARIVADIRAAMGRDDIVLVDTGALKMWMARLYPTYTPNTCLISNGLSTMAWSLPGAIGAKIARPDANVLVATGDGGFLMNSQEIETALHEGIPMVIVIWVDNAYGLSAGRWISKSATTWIPPSAIRTSSPMPGASARPATRSPQPRSSCRPCGKPWRTRPLGDRLPGRLHRQRRVDSLPWSARRIVLVALRHDDPASIHAPHSGYRLSPVLKPRTIRYGPHHSNVGDLWLPVGGTEWVPVVVLVHGGFWRAPYTKRLMNGLAKDVAGRGWAAWNIEYRRVGLLGGGGGWPTTLLDVATAIDHLAVIGHGTDSSRVVTCGHSAGGHLALWLTAPRTAAGNKPGAGVAVAVRGAVSLSGIGDLEEADRLGLGTDATARFMGGHWNEQSERYRHASPRALLPLGVPQVLVHAGQDGVVPPSMSRDYQARATNEGDDARYLHVDGIGHGQLIDPSGAGWRKAVSELERLIG